MDTAHKGTAPADPADSLSLTDEHDRAYDSGHAIGYAEVVAPAALPRESAKIGTADGRREARSALAAALRARRASRV